MKIIEYNESFSENAKDLLVELQSHLVGLDSHGIMAMNDNYRDGYLDYILKSVEDFNGKIFIAKEDGVAIGLIACIMFQRAGAPKFTTTCPLIGYISDIIVTETARGKGVGRALIQHAEEYLVNNQCEHIQLEVHAPNIAAIELYKKCGFCANHIVMSKRVS